MKPIFWVIAAVIFPLLGAFLFEGVGLAVGALLVVAAFLATWTRTRRA